LFEEKRKRKPKTTSVSMLLKIMSTTLRDAALPTRAYSTNIHTRARSRAVPTDFHSASHDIYVDNCASRSITNNMDDFIDTPVPADIRIYGTNGVSTGTLMGTVEWEIEDDQGRTHRIRGPNTIYSASNRRVDYGTIPTALGTRCE
jgi:hypothetical protein